MSIRTPESTDELARARLAYVSMGQRSLTAPRRSADETQPPEEHTPPGQEDVVEAVPADDISAVPLAGGLWDRLALSRTHLLAVGVLLLVALAWLGWQWTRSSAAQVPAAPVSPQPVASSGAEPAPVGATSPSSSPPAPVKLRVHVLGAVATPQVVTLEEGAIVADAIAAAGGLTDDARPGDLNLATPVSAGMQIKVGTNPEDSRIQGGSGAEPSHEDGGASDAASGEPGKLDLNSASSSQLETLPGVGPVTAAAIVAWREEHGRFTNVAELQEISGIGPKTFAKLEPHVRV